MPRVNRKYGVLEGGGGASQAKRQPSHLIDARLQSAHVIVWTNRRGHGKQLAREAQ